MSAIKELEDKYDALEYENADLRRTNKELIRDYNRLMAHRKEIAEELRKQKQMLYDVSVPPRMIHSDITDITMRTITLPLYASIKFDQHVLCGRINDGVDSFGFEYYRLRPPTSDKVEFFAMIFDVILKEIAHELQKKKG